MALPQTDRRKHPRVVADELPILLGADRKTPLRIRDLSRAGVAFYSESPLQVMTKVRFSIEFPMEDGDPVHVTGEGVVVRCERVSSVLAHYEVAVFFSQLDADATGLLGRWVDRHLTSQEA